MTDYIRGKKAYTKWDVNDADNVDLDLTSDVGRQRLHHKPKVVRPNWSSGTKGKAVKILFVIVTFLVGLILGYMVRRGVHEVIQHRMICDDETGIYMYQDFNGNFFKKSVSNDSIALFLRNFSSEAHRVGSESNQMLAESIRDSWKEFGFKTVRIEKFNVLVSQPSNKLSSSIYLVDGTNEKLVTIYKTDQNSPSRTPYLAYSPSKSVKGQAVYVHYGRPEDFKFLESQNISVKGHIVIARNGKIHRGHKVSMSEKLGAIGVILFSDPSDVAPENSDLAPAGIGLPGDGVPMGSLKLSPGDPLTPLTPSIDGMFRIPQSKIEFPSIPVLPIGYNDAHLLLNGLGGMDAPINWQGKLNITYKVGPGFNNTPLSKYEVTLTVNNDLVQKDIFNVIAAIPGEYEPGRYVIVGCHHDSWTEGASDPNSGMAVLMELTRVFGLLLNEGWKPGRTLVFASWDAEEFGVSGSTEWVQYHAKELLHRAVVYINLDVALSGNYSLMAVGSPLLRQVLKEATSSVEWSEEGSDETTVYDVWKTRMPQEKNSALREPEILIPGSGSDFVGFFATQGISAVHLQFIDKKTLSDYPLYHTAYDQYNILANYVDQNFNVAKTLTKIVGIMLMKLTDNLHLPMKAEDYSDHVQKDLNAFVLKYKNTLIDNDIGLEPIAKANEEFKKACHEFHDNYETVNRNNLLLALRQYNDRLIELERSLLLPATACSAQPNFRHTIYGPNLSNVYEGIAFPHLVNAVEKASANNNTESWDEVREQLSYVVYALLSAEGVLNNQILLKKDEL